MRVSRTIEQLEGDPWPVPPRDAPDFVRRCQSLRQLPIDQLSPSDLRVLVGQDIALKYLMPLALALLRFDPLLAAEHYPGDLLSVAMGVNVGFWKTAQGEHAELMSVANRAQSQIAEDTEPVKYRQVSKGIARFLKAGGNSTWTP